MPASPPAGSPHPTHGQLFTAFVRITLAGFGGALPWTRRMFVEQKRWLTPEEFNDVYALCQLLPGWSPLWPVTAGALLGVAGLVN